MITVKLFKISLGILFLCGGQIANAGITGDDLINKILDTSLRTGADIYGKQYVSKTIEKFVSEKFGIPFQGRMGQAFAIYDAGQALGDYDKAKTLSQKSDQAERVVADGITVFYPAVGVIIQLSLLGKKILSAIATKELILRNIELQVTLSRESAELSRWQKAMVEFELKILEDLKIDLFKIGTAINTIDESFRKTCMNIDYNVDLQSNQCLELIDLQLSLATLYKFRIKQLFNLPTQFVKLELLIAPADIVKLDLELTDKIASFDNKKADYLKWRKEIIEQKQIRLRNQITEDADLIEISSIRKCRQVAAETLNAFLQARKLGDTQSIDEIRKQTKSYYQIECKNVEKKINKSTKLILSFLERSL